MKRSGPCRQAPLELGPGQPSPRLYDQVVEVLRARRYSRRIPFQKRIHPRELTERDVNLFLTHLAFKENVAASTQNQALAALLFLYGHVLGQPLNRTEGVVRARWPKPLSVVLTREEAEAELGYQDGVPWLVCTLLYGSVTRVFEGLSLRIKDLDFGASEIIIRDGKGRRDRVTMLPEVLHQPLRDHLESVREQRLRKSVASETRGIYAIRAGPASHPGGKLNNGAVSR